MKTVLHVMSDEKVIDSFISLMESVYPDNSVYLVVITTDEPQLVKSRKNVVFLKKGTKELKQFLTNISGYKLVCLHCIGGEKFYSYIKHSSIAWVIWGADLYESILTFKGYRLYDTFNDHYRVRAGRLPVLLYRILTRVRDYIRFRSESRIVRRLGYIITDNGCDYDVFRHYFPELGITYLGTINYYPIENLIGDDNLDKWCYGKAVWVGNSPAPNGNHIGVFNRLVNLPPDTPVYTPISYGDKRMIKHIDIKGKEILGDRFHPLKDFMPSKEYYSIFLNANSFIFGHYRQCAVGNILMALYFGGRVFLSNHNPLLHMYKRSGFVIFSIEDDLTESLLSIPLSQEEREHNRTLVWSIASKDSSLDQIRNAFKRFIE